MATTIATLRIQGRLAPADDFDILVEIGAPYLKAGNPDVWACPVSIQPWQIRPRDICGDDSFQALCLGIALAQNMLDDFEQKGSSLLNHNEPFSLAAYS
ncbi:MAG TPA: hypothetical protein VMB71_13780, partial [Acetobacteraceae bacterium]|nr:hypothetical protein [Acetobacteraceae bacterium]